MNQDNHQLPTVLSSAFRGEQSEMALLHSELPELTTTLSLTSPALGSTTHCKGYALHLFDHNRLEDTASLSPQAAATMRRLSRAEQRVARLAIKGLSNAQIAEQLYRSKRTVDFQLNRIYRKLSIANRLQLSQLLS